MRRFLPIFAVVLAWASSAQAHGLLIPKDKEIPPLAMVNHHVTITIDDQVSTTQVEQTFRNHTNQQLEATYLFPVPKGASVNKFSMWVNDKEVSGELLDAPKAQQIYTEIVRRTLDPGLLDYMGNNLFRLRIFPVPAKGEQKVKLSFTSLAEKEKSLVEYVYPLKTDGKATQTLEDFSVKATIKSQHAIQNVYSPTHAIAVSRTSDREVKVTFERNQALLDKDFQMFYSLGDQDVGLTALTHRPLSSEDGYFLLMLSPKVETAKDYYVPRDMVLVLDTSGSMHGVKMEQARKALKQCLGNLRPQDRFGLINFSTAVNHYRDGLQEANTERVDDAKKWVDRLKATGGTAINDALLSALAMRSEDTGRSFTVVFFTDGQPTIGETDCDKILKSVMAKNTENTRIFTFGVGESDGLNASFLDQLADKTRAISTYVKPAEDIETKTTALVEKISHPVLTNLKLTSGDKVSLSDVYPQQLPDLFHGGQVVVAGRYTGDGAVALKLTGQVGKETKEFVYEMNFPKKSNDEKAFVEDLWGRRKVGFLLDQIRANGEKAELVQEVTSLAKKYGIATPYTSYLVVPDSVMPVVVRPGDRPAHWNGAVPGVPQALAPAGGAGGPMPVAKFARDLAKDEDGRAAGFTGARGRLAEEAEKKADAEAGKDPMAQKAAEAFREAKDKANLFKMAKEALDRKEQNAVQSDSLGVNLSIQTSNLRNQTRLEASIQRRANSRNCIDVGGVWVDDGFNAKMELVQVKALSEAYFKILEKHPEMKEVFRLGNHLIWVAPNGSALVVDLKEGKETMNDDEIAKLFTAKK
jgi:Ca-activated chloride channel family protein